MTSRPLLALSLLALWGCPDSDGVGEPVDAGILEAVCGNGEVEGDEACGYAVTNFAGITALGAWANGVVQLGNRDLDLGRVFALEADWQDTDNSWTAASTSLMGALITW